jgi:hypothetical protein
MRKRGSDGGEILSPQKDCEKWKLANPNEWVAQQEAERCAIAAHEPERHRMLKQAGRARTVAELGRAEEALFEWIARYPEDAGRELGIIEVLAQMGTRQEALEKPPVLMGWAA